MTGALFQSDALSKCETRNVPLLCVIAIATSPTYPVPLCPTQYSLNLEDNHCEHPDGMTEEGE